LFLPRVPYGMMGTIYRAADALLVHLKDDPLHKITIPGKTQAYMSVRKPILMGIGGDAAFLVEDSRCGLTFRPEDPSSLADTARRLMDLPASEREAMGERGGEYYRTHLSFDVGVERFSELFEELAGAPDTSKPLQSDRPR
jgi:colanic acid biosynthesis glycosyl transferase WcaI